MVRSSLGMSGGSLDTAAIYSLRSGITPMGCLSLTTMMTRRSVLLTAAAALLGAAGADSASAATIVDGAPDMKRLRGKPVAIMFFHPL